MEILDNAELELLDFLCEHSKLSSDTLAKVVSESYQNIKEVLSMLDNMQRHNLIDLKTKEIKGERCITHISIEHKGLHYKKNLKVEEKKEKKKAASFRRWDIILIVINVALSLGISFIVAAITKC